MSKYSPVSFQSRLMIQAAWPERLATCSPEPTSYRAIVRASPAAANSLHPGEKARALIGLIRPATWSVTCYWQVAHDRSRVPGSECSRRPVSLLKTYMLPFSWPDAVKRPSTLCRYSVSKIQRNGQRETYKMNAHAEAALSLEFSDFFL